LKTADSGYLTRKLADVAQNVVVTVEDCGTTQGITKGIIYRGEKVEVRLVDSIRGRVSRTNIVNPITDEVIVRESEMITTEIARGIEDLGLAKIQVRSPMTCEAGLGVCRKCYGMDLSTGSMVEEGMAVGIIGAQSIGEPGTQLTMRTFHIGGTAARAVEESEILAKKSGVAKFTRLKVVRNDGGQQVVLTRNGEISILDPRGRELEKYDIPAGAILMVEDNGEVKSGAALCQWDPHSIPILAEVGGRVRYEDLIDGETVRVEKDPSGHSRRLVMEHKGDFHPQVVIEDSSGKILDFYYLPEKAYLEVDKGQKITAGTLLAKTPRESSGTQDITGGLPRVTEIFEARKPKDPAVIAEIDGLVELPSEKRRGKRSIIVRSESGIEREHLVVHGKHLLVHAGDFVRAGEALVDGPLVPHDILRISGEEAVQQYLTREIQNVYRSQRVEIDDKHIEIIVSQMLRKVSIESPGDTSLLPGNVMDKFEFRRVNQELFNCLKIVDAGDSDFAEDAIIPKDVMEQVNAQIEALGGEPAKGTKPKPATASTQLLGITKASVQSSSFISAASFQETTKVLTEAALAGKADHLVGLKENVILGHLVPAGTGFRSFQESEVRIRPEALEQLAKEKDRTLERSFPLLESAISPAAPTTASEAPMTETPVPENPVSDTPLPGGSVPDGSASESSVSDGSVSDASVPEPPDGNGNETSSPLTSGGGLEALLGGSEPPNPGNE